MARNKTQDRQHRPMEETDDRFQQIQEQLQKIMDGMANINNRNLQNEKELLELRGVVGTMNSKENERVEYSNGREGSNARIQEGRKHNDDMQEVRMREGNGRGGNFFSRYSRLEFPKFSGLDLRTWLYKVDQLFSIDEIPFNQRVKVASVHLEGDAIAWHRAFIKSRNSVVEPTWTEYILALNERFGDNFEDPMEAL